MAQYPFSEQKYLPHFTVGDIYIDILEISETGESIYGSEYIKDAKWRIRQHRKNRTKYIQIPTWRWNNNSIYKYLEGELKNFGVKISRRSESDILKLIQEKRPAEWQEFCDLLHAFLSLHKNSSEKLTHIQSRFEKIKNQYDRTRATIFLSIYVSYYINYEQYLFDARKYDFADMINLAAKNVRELPDCAKGYRYILLDEVQDLSLNRQLLIREILRKNPGCKLFAVGDDWQSIYRFAGSNLALIRNFAKAFGLPTRRNLIETTHRFAAPTVKISSDFVQKNPLQERKNIHSNKTGETPIEIIFNEPDDEAPRGSDVPAFERAVEHLIDIYGAEALRRKSLQIISRYNHDSARLSNANIAAAEEKIVWHNADGLTLEFEFCSMHKSKGVTRDIVIVLNMNNDVMGMPAQRETEPILDLLLAKEEPYAYAEERRLFYVAITRARDRTILLANRKNPSPFLFEICSELTGETGYFCPKCEIGELITKNMKNGIIKYCSNFMYGCDYFKRE